MSTITYGALTQARRISLSRAIAGVTLVLHDMLRARTTRRMLVDMDDRLLSDIGIGRGDARHEASRPMWDLAQRHR